MDADSSYGGSDTAQDSHSGHDNSSSLETTHNDVTTTANDPDGQQQEPNNFYHKNEITLPVNYDEADFQENKTPKQPHYLSTANLNINDTLEHHSNLEEMSKNYKSTNYLNESPRMRKKSDAGVDNPAFQEEEYKPEVKSTFDNNKPYNGDLNSSAMLGLTSPNKNDEPLTEAVNLELINLKPSGKDVTGAYENGTNGMTSIPVKKENDAEIGNPYDEYFVPVNEHRKYMRGEKLYVTMDKRNKKKRNKCLCWGLCLCIVAAAVIIGILAAVGVIGNQGPHPAQEVSARHFGSTNEPEVKAAGGIFGLPRNMNDETTIPPEAKTPRLTPGPPVITVSSMLPTTETSMIQVPRALESQLVIDNLEFTPALANKNSTEYKNLAKALETELKNSLFTSDMLNYGPADIEVKVLDFASGSVVVKYRITWVFKDGIHNLKDPIDEAMLKRKMNNVLGTNNGFMNTYHIADNTVTVEKILDLCKIDNNGCEYNCSFDYNLADFICSCPDGKYLGHDQKSCTDETIIEPETAVFDNVYPYHHHEITTTPSSVPEPSSEPNSEHEHDHNIHHHHHFEPTAEPSPEPEPTAEPSPEPEPTAEPAPEPEPTSEPVAEPKQIHTYHEMVDEHSEESLTPPSTSPEPTHKPEEVSHDNYVRIHNIGMVASETTPEPIAEPTTEPHSHGHEHNHHSFGESIAEPTTEPVPNHNTEIKVEHEAETVAEPTSEPLVEHNIVTTVKYVMEHSTEPPTEVHMHHYVEPVAEPTSEPIAEPTSEPHAEPTSESVVEHNNITTVKAHTEPAMDHIDSVVEAVAEPTPEPNAEPTVEHNHIIVQSTSEAETEPIAEPTAEPTIKDDTKPVSLTVIDYNSEPSAEPTAEPISEHTTEQNRTETSSELYLEPVVDHNIHYMSQPTVQPVVEHITEPIGEPAQTLSSENVKLVHEVITEVSSELTTKPTSNIKSETDNETRTELSVNSIHAQDSKTGIVVDQVVITTSEVNTEATVESSSETIIKSSSSHSVHTVPETSTIWDNEVHVSISSTDFTPKIVTTMSPVVSTTNHLNENDYTQNHISHEIVTEPEMTTMLNVKVQEVPIVEGENVLSTEKSMNMSVEVSTTSNLSNPEMKTETVITSTLSPVLQSEDKLNNSTSTDKPEMTTVGTLPETTTTKQSHEENLLIPVSVNEQSRFLQVHHTTESPENQTLPIPIIVNNQPAIYHTGHIEITNQTAEPKIVEIITHSPDMTKIFTELHKVMEDQHEHSTEMVTSTTTNGTHMNIGVVESTENTSAMDNMSPFLPEIDNDTFVNKLHLGEHVIPHIQNETHEDETAETLPPPRLDNDQMNATNPHDANPIDTSLKVVPLEGNENEILDKLLVTEAPKSDEESKQTHNHIVPVLVQHEEVVITTTASSNMTETAKENLNITESAFETANKAVPVMMINNSTESAPMETTMKPFVDTAEPRLSSEIVNNIHSNVYFDNVGRNYETVNKENETYLAQNNTNRIGTSTEDLIALETTTNGKKIIENKSIAEVTTEASGINQTITTIHAEILETVTESIPFDNSKIENSTVTQTESVLFGNNSTNVTQTESVPFNNNSTNMTQTEMNLTSTNHEHEIIATTISSEVTTMATPSSTSHLYEVNEPLVDVSTTERLFVIAKSTTANPIITKADYEDLSVVPLIPDEEKSSKVNEKRVAHDAINQLESESNNSVNDISEEHTYHQNLNEISTINKKPTDSTTIKADDVSNTEMSYGFTKYDESKISKKNYLDKEKPKFEKKVKLEKVITTITNDEILAAGVPNDNQSHPFSDIKPVTEDFSISGFTRCTYGQFHCVNGTSIKDGSYCIPESDRCDSVDDCSDASDEIDCVKDGCPNNFQCASGQCLKRHLVCDGIQNCNDGSDEIVCDHWTCRFDEFSCGPGSRCLPILWKCDGRAHCSDGSDEHNCPSTMCTEDSFLCSDQNTCVPKSWKCDGKPDCMNAEDEKSCECGNDEFKCAIGGGCIKNAQTCDGIDHCADKSDEWNCLNLEKEAGGKKYLEVKVSNNSWYPVCSDKWNQTHSDLVCRNLGYGGSSLTENINKPAGDFKEYFKIKSDTTYGSPILSQLEKSDTCDSFISITCQEFSCGSHSTLDVHSARIIGGNRGTETQWPSLTLLYNKRRNLQCTATLIAPIWVIASHSCVFNFNSRLPVLPNDWILYAGSTNFFSNPDNSTTQVGQVKRILSHPQAKYSQFEFTNDVVLIELSKPLTMTRNVSAMCLPDKDIEPRQLCVIAGWGVSKPGEPSKNQYLHYLPVPIIDSEECNSTKHYNGLMTKDKICAGYTEPEKTPCYNDEGAPLMCFSDTTGTWELQGILSHHDNCARSKHPAVYTSINDKMRKWVINTIGQKPSRSA